MLNPVQAIRRFWSGDETKEDKDSSGTDLFRYIASLLRDAQTYRFDQTAKNWPRNDRYYQGRQWDVPQTKSGIQRLTLNQIAAILHEKVALMTNSQPRFLLSRRDALASESEREVERNEQILSAEWARTRAQRKLREALLWGALRGRVQIRTSFDPSLNHPFGAIRIDAVNPLFLFADPAADSGEEAAFVVFAHPEDMEALKARYGARVEGISPDSAFSVGNELADWTPASLFEMRSPAYDSRGGASAHYSRPRAVVVEAWFKDASTVKRKVMLGGQEVDMDFFAYPTGRKVVFVGNRLVEDAPNPYPWLPFDGFPWYWNLGSFWGLDEVVDLIDAQNSFNVTWSALTAEIQVSANTQWLADNKAGLDPNKWYGRPGTVVVYKAGGKVERIPPSPVSAGMLATIVALKREMRERSGINEISPPQKLTHTPASSMENQQSRGLTRVAYQIAQMDEMLESMAGKMLWMIQHLYSEPRVFSSADEATTTSIEATGTQAFAGDWDVKIAVGSTLPFSTDQQFTKAVALAGMRMLDQKAVLDAARYPDRDKIIARMKSEEAQAPGPLSTERRKPPKQGTSRLAAKILTKFPTK